MKKKSAFIISLFLMQACSNSDHTSTAQSVADGNKVFNSCVINSVEDVPKQMPCLETNAKAGSAIDQYNLAIALREGFNGEGVDPQKSFFWMHKAAENGRSDAQLNLGVMYLDGFGVYSNREKALFWLNKAFANGRSEAYSNLGRLYEEMEPTNKKLAFEYYQKAVDAGSNFAKASLGRCYLYGIGVSVDINRGLSLLQEAADENIEPAQNILIKAYIQGNIIPKDYKKAFELSQKYAQAGTAVGLYNLGVMYEEGWGTQVNHEKAVEYFQKAVDKNNISAKYNLALMLWEGKYIKKDQDKAIVLFREAAESNCGNAMDSLVRIFLQGTEVHQFWNAERKKLKAYQDLCTE